MKVSIPLTSLSAPGDSTVDEEQVRAWAEVTTGPAQHFSMEAGKLGHNFLSLEENQAFIIDTLTSICNSSTSQS
jgi:surfactin synthase thioesterase subunit